MPEDHTDEAKQIDEATKVMVEHAIAMCADSPLFSHATKREVFAAMAMQGMLSADENDLGGYGTVANLAIGARRVADALLAELAKPQEPADAA